MKGNFDMSTEKIESITKELENTGTLATAEFILSNFLPEQYTDFLQQLDECLTLQIPLTEDILNRIFEVVNETVYFDCDYAALCN